MTMHLGLADVVILAWLPISAGLFRAIGPRRAVLVGIIGGYLFLPIGHLALGPPGTPFLLHKFTSTGLGLILGALLFDGRTLLRARPGWLDLPMAVFYLAPLIGLAAGVPGSRADVLDAMIGRGLGWVAPYAMGRLYFGRGDGPGSLAVALAIAGLSYIPVCLYEEVAGPTRYLAGLIYGQPYNAAMVDRLGGYRPEGFLGDGINLAGWIASTAVLATWLSLGGRRIGRWPAWPAAAALVLASLSCRGVYGYVLLAIGLIAAFLTRWLRSRAVLAALLVLPILYMGLRATGAWDGRLIVRAVTFTGRQGTVEYRLLAEDRVIDRVLGHDPIVGFGNYIWNAKLDFWPDGAWLHALWMGGLVGLASWAAASHVVPAALALSRPPGRPDGPHAASPSWALGCWCILMMIDGLHNASYSSPTALIAGCLVGSFARDDAGAFERRAAASRVAARRWSPPVALIVTAVVLIAVEIIGQLSRSSAPSPSSPAVEGHPARNRP